MSRYWPVSEHQLTTAVTVETRTMSAQPTVQSIAEQIIISLDMATWEYDPEIGELEMALPGSAERPGR